jgi:hypothetical protein
MSFVTCSLIRIGHLRSTPVTDKPISPLGAVTRYLSPHQLDYRNGLNIQIVGHQVQNN